MIVERRTALGTWVAVGELGCDCGDPACADPHGDESVKEMAEDLVRGADVERGNYRVMAGDREVHRFTVGVEN